MRAKNAERMRGIRKDQEYHERENNCRNEARKKKKEAKQALLRVPRAICWQEKVANIEAISGIATTIYRINTKVDMVEVKTHTHEIISADYYDKDIKPVCNIHRNERGNIKRSDK